jgi:hypothetical protein
VSYNREFNVDNKAVSTFNNQSLIQNHRNLIKYYVKDSDSSLSINPQRSWSYGFKFFETKNQLRFMQISLTKSKFEIYLFYFSIIDLFFLPYVPFVATTFSQILMVWWFLATKNKKYNLNEFKAYGIFVFFVFIGIIASLIYLQIYNGFEDYIINNIKSAIQIILMLLYYFFFYHISLKYKIRIKNFLLIFLFYVFLWGILYYLNFYLFLDLKTIFNAYDNYLVYFQERENFYRFSFIWTDPNNITYIAVGVMIYLMTNLKIKFHYVILSFLIVCTINILAMSSGGWLSLLLFGLPALGFRFKKELSRRFMSRLTILVSFFGVMLFYSTSIIDYLSLDDIYLISIERNEMNSGNSRFEKWNMLLEDKMDVLPIYFFFGTGMELFLDNKPFGSHNGHFTLIFAYGLMGYLAFMYIVFRKIKTIPWIKYLYILPLLLGFTINIMFTELKLMGIIFLIIAQSRVFDNAILKTKN